MKQYLRLASLQFYSTIFRKNILLLQLLLKFTSITSIFQRGTQTPSDKGEEVVNNNTGLGLKRAESLPMYLLIQPLAGKLRF